MNRTETPWLIVLMHCPLYNSYVHHYMEGETMRVMYELWFVKYKVDVVFSGHVHAYERSVSSHFSFYRYLLLGSNFFSLYKFALLWNTVCRFIWLCALQNVGPQCCLFLLVSCNILNI